MNVSAPVALYIHVPFCLSICPYCDFVVVAGRAARGPANRLEAFLAAIHVELDLRADDLDTTVGSGRAPLSSIYLGGGTPSLLGPSQVCGLLDHVARRFGIARDAEITLEANPGRGDRGDLAGFRAAGVNRLSLGVQSLDPAELRTLGRRHGPADVTDAVAESRAARFRSVNLDLLYDVPGQSLRSWEWTLHAALRLEPDHVSAYALALDDPDAEGATSPLGDRLPLRPGAGAWRRRARPAQDEDRAADQYEMAERRLVAAGLRRYELSNWARRGHESRHNLAYWRCEAVEAVGPGAHAFDGALTRRWNAARLEPYIASLRPADGGPAALPPGGRERLDPATGRAEAAILGLRLRTGIDGAALLDPALAAGLEWGIEAGLVEAGRRLRLTSRGRLLASELFVRLLPDTPRAAPRAALHVQGTAA